MAALALLLVFIAAAFGLLLREPRTRSTSSTPLQLIEVRDTTQVAPATEQRARRYWRRPRGILDDE